MVFTKIKNMKKLISILLLFLTINVFAQEGELDWHTDVNKAIELSIESEKPLFMFFTGSDWCGWCIRLQKRSFLLSLILLKLGKRKFNFVELDFPRRKKLMRTLKQQNDNLRQMFAVRGYPTGWFVVPEIEDKKVNFKRLGSQGYVAGGPTNWINGK